MADKKGRKNKYDTHVSPYLEQIAAWCRDGATDEEIYKRLGVGKDSFYRYKKEHSELSDILKRNKELIDIQVENSLLKRAMGYSYTETTYEKVKLPNGTETDAVKVKEVVKEVQPDTTAQIFWLKNRKPAQWRDKHDVEHSGNIKLEDFFK